MANRCKNNNNSDVCDDSSACAVCILEGAMQQTDNKDVFASNKSICDATFTEKYNISDAKRWGFSIDGRCIAHPKHRARIEVLEVFDSHCF